MSSQFTIKPLFFTLILLSVLAIVIKFQYTTTISPVTASAPANVFSSERAFNFLQQLTKEQVPHPVDSLANRIVEQRIVSILESMGYQPKIQESPTCLDSSKGFARCTTVRNIIVNVQGTSSNKGILLAAHYDSVPAGPGGSDAGAAVGTLLETARLLTLTKQPLNSIVLLFNEGEEFGLLGAKAFMEHHPLAKQLKLAINVEARGSTGKSVMFETGENSGWLVEHYSNATPAPLSSSLFYEVYKFLPNDTDLTVFKEYGLQGLNFAHADRLAHYHTPLDNLKNLEHGSLQHHGDNVWGVLAQIKDLDLTSVNTGNIVYSDILGLFVIQWSESISLWASILFLALFAFITFLYKESLQLNAKQQVKNLLTCMIILASSAISAFIILQTVRLLSGHYAPWYANQLSMQLSVWLSVLLLNLIIGKYFVRKSSAINVVSSVTLLWIVLSITTSIWLTGVSFLFLIPAAVGLLGLFVLAKSGNSAGQNNVTAQITVFIMFALAGAVMFMPIAFILELMVGYSMSLAIGIILGFILLTLLPLLTFTSSVPKHFNQLVGVIALLMIGTVSWTSYQPAYSSWLPQRLNINYIQNEQSQAFITTGFAYKEVPKSLATSFSQPSKQAEIFPWSKKRYHVTNATSQQQIAPIFEVLNENEEKTQVIAQITTAQVNAENAQLSDIKLYIPVDSGLISIEVNSYTIQYKGDKNNSNGFYEYHCRGIKCANIEVTMNFEQQKISQLNQEKNIFVLSAYPGIPQIFSKHLTARGATSVPSQLGDQSIVYNKFTF